MKRAVVAGLILLMTTACGSRVAEDRRQLATAGRSVIPAGETSRGTSAPSSSTSSSAPRATGGAGPPASAARSFFEPKTEGDFDLAITVEPLCVQTGSAGVATIVTKPKVGLGLMVSYSDRDVAGPYTIANADATGRYLWTFAIPADAPTGASEVLVGAVDWETGEGVTGRTGFTIATSC